MDPIPSFRGRQAQAGDVGAGFAGQPAQAVPVNLSGLKYIPYPYNVAAGQIAMVVPFHEKRRSLIVAPGAGSAMPVLVLDWSKTDGAVSFTNDLLAQGLQINAAPYWFQAPPVNSIGVLAPSTSCFGVIWVAL